MADQDTRVPGFFLVLFPGHGLNNIRAVLTEPDFCDHLGVSKSDRSMSQITEVYGFTGYMLNQFLEAHLIQWWCRNRWQADETFSLFADGSAGQDILWNIAGQLIIHGMLQDIGLFPASP
ncbi:hypothetical protein [Faecalibaculum rodentium]|uniref:hypothetical protein n=1 Tax=Faecalibaculum rodentium TaxID=1702221 RepID=UPI0023EFDBDB|nr:hypothetical protein [Faecalibaculum rodentium]